MASLPVTELTQRAREIFRRVVEEYIESGQPVGSKTLAADGTLNLSPASIRSVLADLETAGLLAAPHTSAGRMPTDAGLRIFVDGMMRVAEPTREEQAAIEARLAEAGPVEAALKQASAILSDLSGAAGMVLVAPREQRLAQFSLVDLGQGRARTVTWPDRGVASMALRTAFDTIGNTADPGWRASSSAISASMAIWRSSASGRCTATACDTVSWMVWASFPCARRAEVVSPELSRGRIASWMSAAARSRAAVAAPRYSVEARARAISGSRWARRT